MIANHLSHVTEKAREYSKIYMWQKYIDVLFLRAVFWVEASILKEPTAQ
jgi:hypothetical protein